jgi:hypothetical protein
MNLKLMGCKLAPIKVRWRNVFNVVINETSGFMKVSECLEHLRVSASRVGFSSTEPTDTEI